LVARELTTSAAAARIGVRSEVLLQWERRYGWPVPARRANGHRAYRQEVVDALVSVPAWRDAGVPLREALATARQAAQLPDDTGLSVRHLQEILDCLDAYIVVVRAPTFEIELVNAPQRAVLPAHIIVGRPAREVLVHSVGYIDTDAVLRHVATTGEPVHFREQRIPIGDESRWWNVTYQRLSPKKDEHVRVLITAIEVTEYVLARLQRSR
jgi:DNA-binding transcriptional MerR regulator